MIGLVLRVRVGKCWLSHIAHLSHIGQAYSSYSLHLFETKFPTSAQCLNVRNAYVKFIFSKMRHVPCSCTCIQSISERSSSRTSKNVAGRDSRKRQL